MVKIGITTAPINLTERKTAGTISAYFQSLIKCGKWYSNNANQNLQEV